MLYRQAVIEPLGAISGCILRERLARITHLIPSHANISQLILSNPIRQHIVLLVSQNSILSDILSTHMRYFVCSVELPVHRETSTKYIASYPNQSKL